LSVCLICSSNEKASFFTCVLSSPDTFFWRGLELHTDKPEIIPGCYDLTWQPAAEHQTAARSPLPSPSEGWGGEMDKRETRGLR